MPATNNTGSEWLEVKICLELVSLCYCVCNVKIRLRFVKICLELVSLCYCVCNVKIRLRRETDHFFYRLGGGGLDEQRRSGWRSQRLSDA